MYFSSKIQKRKLATEPLTFCFVLFTFTDQQPYDYRLIISYNTVKAALYN